jgi:hypothetical protein
MYNLLSKNQVLESGEKSLTDLGLSSGKLAEFFTSGAAKKAEEKAWNKVCID